MWGVGMGHERHNMVGAETVGSVEGNMCGTARFCRPTRVEGHITHERIASEPGRSHVRPGAAQPPRPASGRRGAVADDARAWEVSPRCSSREADEQGRATVCGAGRAKGGDQGEGGPAKRTPATGPGKCVTC